MRTSALFAAVVVAISFVGPSYGQTPDDKKPFTLRVEGSPGGQRAPLERQIGDSVAFDESTLDIVATSNGVTQRLRPQNLSRPAVRSTISQDGTQIGYSYEFLNQAGAEHPFGGVSIPIEEPAKTMATAPPGWVALPTIEQSILFLQRVRDDELSKMITGGKSAGEFRLESDQLPGLVLAWFHGGAVERREAGKGDSDRLSAYSPWERQQVLELEIAHPERSRKLVWILAPAIDPSEDSLERIRALIRQAQEISEVGAIYQRLDAARNAERIEDAVKPIELAAAEAVPKTLAHATSHAVLLRLDVLKRRGIR